MSDTELTLPEEQAFQLSRCAITLDNAWEGRDKDLGGLVEALNANLELWIAIRTMAMRSDCTLSQAAKDNLKRLAEFVASSTFAGIENLTKDVVRTLVNINLQISEGLLEGTKAPA